MPRIVSWFSCGAASAVATRMALDKFAQTPAGAFEFVIGYTEVKEEHPDNMRFLKDCEEWFNHPITIMGNDKYNRSIYEVFRKERFLVGPKGAACTKLLKKQVREEFQRDDDIQVFGYTAEEQHRLDQFIDSNPDVDIYCPLIEAGVSKADCLGIIDKAGISLPYMYEMGYHNNNCVGCVKGQAGYWNKIRLDFPETFERMSQVEQTLGRTICKKEWREDGKRHSKRVYLKDLDPEQGDYELEDSIECGIVCEWVDSQFMRNEE